MSVSVLSVDASSTSCTDEPVAIDGTPAEHSVLFVLPYQQVNFNVNYMSQLERYVPAVGFCSSPQRTNIFLLLLVKFLQ